jgi:hypothetical protein
MTQCLCKNSQHTSKTKIYNHTVHSENWTIKWSKDIAIAINNATKMTDTVFVEDVETNEEGSVDICASYNVLSILGPIISLDEGWNTQSGMHPSYGSDTKTVNLDDHKKSVSLLSLFDSTLIFNALIKDTIIHHYLRIFVPHNITDLINNLDGECEVDFSGFITRFAIENITMDSVDIYFGLKYGCEADRGKFTEFTITLPIPAIHRSWFNQARENKTYIDNVQ